MQAKTCTRCGKEKPLDEFHNHKGRKDGKTAWCKACAVEYQARLRAERNTDPAARAAWLEARKRESRAHYAVNRGAEGLRKRKQNRRVKEEIIRRYGGRCACCGETILEFLAIDHINGGGNAHRRALGWRRTGHNFYRWLRDNNYPGGFQVLCHNCNWGKHVNGGVCPHQQGETVR